VKNDYIVGEGCKAHFCASDSSAFAINVSTGKGDLIFRETDRATGQVARKTFAWSELPLNSTPLAGWGVSTDAVSDATAPVQGSSGPQPILGAFSAEMVSNRKRVESTALWLSSYLAHWEMFRGSSNLKEANHDSFKFLVTELLRPERGILYPVAHLQFHELHSLKSSDFNLVLYSLTDVLESCGVTATDTLRSKIILGLTQNVPGYDRFFKKGLVQLKSEGVIDERVGQTLTGNNIIELSRWYSKNDWPTIRSPINGVLLPSGRIVDMVLNQYGRDLEIDERP
jgi:hypothetical protein